MRRDAEQALTLMYLLSWVLYSMCHSPPGRPRLTRCRSPEKETFTCWWEPGSTGGLPTSYHLYYRKESSLEVFECPDYHKAGNNSCYFDKRHTSIWIIYNITVVASNALGKAYSEYVEIDVMDIVQPHPPENVNVTLMQRENSPYILVQWQPPQDADTRSGWVTIKYEVCIKIENSRGKEDHECESYSAGKQLDLSIYSPQPGANYIVQVRCKLDQGLWSEWSPSAFIQIPDKTSDRQNVVMIFAVTLTGFIFLLTAGMLVVKIKHVKHFLLPTVPEPKINGLDTQLLKSGKSEEIFRALITQGYPQLTHGSERQVEYLVVSEMEFDGKAYLEEQKENFQTDHTQEIPQNTNQITQNSSQGLNTTQSEQSVVPGHDSQCCISEIQATFKTIHPGTTSYKLSAPSIDHLSVLGVTQQLPNIDYHGLQIKTQDHDAADTHLSSSSKCDNDQRKVSITPAGLTGYVEVDEEKALVGEDYSMVSDVMRDNVLVLQKDNTPVQGHKEVKRGKVSESEEAKDVIETLGYLETVTMLTIL
ncbi:prolactin receptor-like [Xyrauchen texanus]|uniref:prolactin receptor-like n=1 Tax=Xyrauchen texanus TaxID=154827 RepID=UPI0022428AF2|nr:prolactin receptor-like [Xyrauchen texanus]